MADFSAGSKLYGVGQVDEDLVAVCTPAVEQVEAEQKAPGVQFECRTLSSTSAVTVVASCKGVFVIWIPRDRESQGDAVAGRGSGWHPIGMR